MKYNGMDKKIKDKSWSLHILISQVGLGNLTDVLFCFLQ